MPDTEPLIVTCTECETRYDADEAPCPFCGSSGQTVDRYELRAWHADEEAIRRRAGESNR